MTACVEFLNRLLPTPCRVMDVALTGKISLPLPDEHSAEATRGRKIVMHRISGSRKRIPGPKKARALWLPVVAINPSAVLLLAALAALLGCGLVSSVLATPLPDGTSADEGPVKDADFTRIDCCAHTATLLHDAVVFQRSLAECSDSLAVSEAHAQDWERTARNLQLENAALRSRLEAPPSLEASSRIHGSRTAPDAGRIPYPKTLPVIVAQHGNRWQVPIAELACSTDSLYLQRRTLT